MHEWEVPAQVIVTSLNEATLVAELIRPPEFTIENGKLRRNEHHGTWPVGRANLHPPCTQRTVDGVRYLPGVFLSKAVLTVELRLAADVDQLGGRWHLWMSCLHFNLLIY